MTVSRVFYFSGTGNSFYVAKRIADQTGAVLDSIVCLNEGDVIETDMLCFVFPIYDSKPPGIVTEIVQSLVKIDANYCVAIGTYGVALSSALFHFKETLKSKGVVQYCGFGIKSPHNAVGSVVYTEKENNARIAKAEDRISEIITQIRARTDAGVEKNSFLSDKTLFSQIPHILKLVFILLFKGAKALKLTVTNDCINCSQCIRICPVNNIKLHDKKPIIGECCTSCFACLQWCPTSAIHFGTFSLQELGIQHYQHPEVSSMELSANNQKHKKS